MTDEVRDVSLPVAFQDLFRPAPYKIYHGGRGGAKSRSFALALVARAFVEPIRVLCTREFQSSIGDSVHRLLDDQITALGLQPWFTVGKASITSSIGAEFIFKGLRMNIQEIKSTEGIDVLWVEEGQSVSDDHWEIILPTIRKDGSEIWVSFNPGEETDPTFQRFVINPPPGAIVRKVGWQDNPWFTSRLDEQRRYMLALDQEAYDHVWEGLPRKLSNAVIFRNRVSVEAFATPELNVRFFLGMDFGFANDPSALVRFWIDDDCLMIDYEAFGWHVELDDLWKLMAGRAGATTEQLRNWKSEDDVKYPGIPGARDWPIKADNSRPETISYLARQGFQISAAEKWPGSVEDGITHLKGFRRIIIHERCVNLAQEARLYSYKVDPKTNDVLPIIVDKFNHGWDATRYGLDGYIQRRGGTGVWARLGAAA